MTSTIITPADMTDTSAVLAAYRAADKKGMAAIRKALGLAREAAVDALDRDLLTALNVTRDALTAPAKVTVQVDYQAVVQDRIATLLHAAHLLTTGQVTPDGFPEGFNYNPDVTREVSADVDVATTLAGAKVTRSGKQHDIPTEILAALNSVPAGTWLTMTEIGNMRGVSNGAVGASLFNKDGCRVAGVELKGADGSCTKAVRLAV